MIISKVRKSAEAIDTCTCTVDTGGILFPNHGPHKGIISTNIQRKNHNYIEYSYTMTYLSQHIKSNKQVINNNHVVFVARLQSLIQIIFDKFAHCIKY